MVIVCFWNLALQVDYSPEPSAIGGPTSTSSIVLSMYYRGLNHYHYDFEVHLRYHLL